MIPSSYYFRLLGLAGGLLASCACGQEPLFSNVTTYFSPVSTGSYVRHADGSYERLSAATVGQYQEPFAPFSFYTAFAVFDLPNFDGPLSSAQLHVPPGEVPDGTMLSAHAFAASLFLSEVAFKQSWYISLQLDVRLAEVPVGSLIDGSIDAATAFAALSAGSLIGSVVIPTPGDWPATDVAVPFDDAFQTAISEGMGGPFVLSFTMPFVQDSRDDNRELLNLTLDGSFETWLDIYRYEAPLISPVPEPSTYAIAAAGLCVAVAVWRRRRRASDKGSASEEPQFNVAI